jgi:hypothetical protein
MLNLTLLGCCGAFVESEVEVARKRAVKWVSDVEETGE